MKLHGNKKTQGNIKMNQYLEDLERNKDFKRALKRVTSALKKQEDSKDARFSQMFGYLIEEYRKLNKVAKKLIKKFDAGFSRADNSLSEKYKLDTELFNAIAVTKIMTGHANKLKDFWKVDIDMCTITDRHDDITYPGTLELPVVIDRSRLKHAVAYPISIDIHAFASQRDILDFVEKRWSRIEELLSVHRNEKRIRFRKRKHSRQMIDFLWDNKHLKSTKLKNKLDKKFPKNGLVYYEISKLISGEKKRRAGLQ